MRNFVLFSHITSYIQASSAYISKKYMQIVRILICFSAHNIL